jgi:hypothetical protein
VSLRGEVSFEDHGATSPSTSGDPLGSKEPKYGLPPIHSKSAIHVFQAVGPDLLSIPKAVRCFRAAVSPRHRRPPETDAFGGSAQSTGLIILEWSDKTLNAEKESVRITSPACPKLRFGFPPSIWRSSRMRRTR